MNLELAAQTLFNACVSAGWPPGPEDTYDKLISEPASVEDLSFVYFIATMNCYSDEVLKIRNAVKVLAEHHRISFSPATYSA